MLRADALVLLLRWLRSVCGRRCRCLLEESLLLALLLHFLRLLHVM